MDQSADFVPLSPLPADLIQIIEKRPRRANAQTPTKPQSTHLLSEYAEAALKREVQDLSAAPPGTRNDALNRAAFALGQLICEGLLSRSEVEERLYSVAESSGLVADDGAESVHATIRSGIEAGMENPREPKPGSSEIPEIRITTHIPEVVDAALAALLSHEGDTVYQKGGILVRVTRVGRKMRGYKRAPDAPLISPLPDGRLLELMAASAEWRKLDRRVQGWVPAMPPKWAVQVLSARGQWAFPYIESITETPTLRPDGTVLQDSGFDEVTGTLYLPNTTFPTVPDRPTQSDAAEALAELFEPFTDFPFKTGADASILTATILTVLARPAIAGVTPFFVLRKNAPAVGGTLAADAISIIATGRPAPRMTLSPDAAEMRKLILTIAIEGTPLVLFDNLEGVVGSPILAAAITAESWSDRLLGFNKTARAPLRPVWIATGNGLSFNRDIGRRVALCDMVTQLEHPEDRTDFRHDDLLGHVAEARPRLVVAALTILRGYCVARRPSHGKPRKGGFVGWDDLVRGALIWASADDPMETTRRVRVEADSDLDALRVALVAWRSAFREPRTAASAVDHARNHDTELLDALAALAGCPTDKLDGQRFGYALRRYRERIVGGLRFTKPRDDGQKTGLWTIEEI